MDLLGFLGSIGPTSDVGTSNKNAEPEIPEVIIENQKKQIRALKEVIKIQGEKLARVESTKAENAKLEVLWLVGVGKEPGLRLLIGLRMALGFEEGKIITIKQRDSVSAQHYRVAKESGSAADLVPLPMDSCYTNTFGYTSEDIDFFRSLGVDINILEDETLSLTEPPARSAV